MFVGLGLVYTLISVLAIFVVAVRSNRNNNATLGRRKKGITAFYLTLSVVLFGGVGLSFWNHWFWLWIVAVIIAVIVLVAMVDGLDRRKK